MSEEKKDEKETTKSKIDETPDLDTDEAIRVFIRVRPLNKREKTGNESFAWNFNKTALLEETQNGQRVYAYDRCYGPDDNNQIVYQEIGKPMVLKCMKGFNGTVFSYGQTGSGKTWTMRGNDDDPGMMMQCIDDIFEFIEVHPEKEYKLKVSYMEVYNEEINDLLGDGSPLSKNLKIIAEDNIRGASIGNLVEVEVSNGEEMMAALKRGEESRSYGSTIMNAESSRSHTIYRLIISTYEPEEADDDDDGLLRAPSESKEKEPSCVSYLNLVDLAGSERQKSTGASGSTLKEGANINKSLLALGAVINKLGEASKKTKKGKDVFIPYRDSKLTRILKSSLGGNALTSIVCAVSPASGSREETVSTLKFGQVCKSIKKKATSNEVVDDKSLIRNLKAQVAELKTQLDEANEKLEGGGGPMMDLSAIDLGEGGDTGEGGGGGNMGNSAASQALRQALREREELLNKIQVLEGVMGDASVAGEDAEGDAAKSSGVGAGTSVKNLIDDLVDAQRRSRDAETTVKLLKQKVEMFGDIEESRKQAEEEKMESIQGLAEESDKIAREREGLQDERQKVMQEREAMDEKESRLGMLLSALDERDSKLRQHMSMIQEQKKQWENSVRDLRRREDLVNDWQKKHSSREARLKERDEAFEKKLKELRHREAENAKLELRIKADRKSLSEREQRLDTKLSRSLVKEQEVESELVRVGKLEEAVSTRESELDLKERELAMKRRELERWDALLRDKDEKLAEELKSNDERESIIYQKESELRDSETEQRELEMNLVKREHDCSTMRDQFQRGIEDIQNREKSVDEQDKRLHKWHEELTEKEIELGAWDSKLKILQRSLVDVEQREADIRKASTEFEQAKDEFYNIEVQRITRRHAEEMAELEDLVSQQLKTVAAFQAELDRTRTELQTRCSDNDQLQNMISEREQLVQSLRDQVGQLKDDHAKMAKEAEHARKTESSSNRSTKKDLAIAGTENGDGDGASSDIGYGPGGGWNTSNVGKQNSAGSMVGVGGESKMSKRSFLLQLAETQKMLERLLSENQLKNVDNKEKPPARRATRSSMSFRRPIMDSNTENDNISTDDLSTGARDGNGNSFLEEIARKNAEAERAAFEDAPSADNRLPFISEEADDDGKNDFGTSTLSSTTGTTGTYNGNASSIGVNNGSSLKERRESFRLKSTTQAGSGLGSSIGSGTGVSGGIQTLKQAKRQSTATISFGKLK